ncbi:MAG: glucose-6-phosphate isomerase, partial [Patescibacteria group bacterium]
MKLPKLSPQLLAVRKIADSLKGKFKNMAILGIGGSALGITCLRDAMKGRYHHLKNEMRVFVLDNLDGIQDFEEVVNLDETLFVVISKSGTTPETMAQYFYFREKVSREHFVFITDPDKGELRQIGLD